MAKERQTQLENWLRTRNARCMWELPCPDYNFSLACWAVPGAKRGGALVIVQLWKNSDGWEMWVQGSDSGKVLTTFADVEKRLGLE